MRQIIFVQATPYLPNGIAGANVSLHALCTRLCARGIEPIVICAPDRPDAAPMTNTVPLSIDYPVLRHADPVEALREAAGRLPRAAIVARAPDPAERIAAIAEIFPRPLHFYFESAFYRQAFPTPAVVPNLRYAANSPFLARMAAAFFASPVPMIPPVIEPESYRCAPRGDHILFVNPIAMKGVHIVAAIAERLPHRRFLVVRSWNAHPQHPHIGIDRPNVEMTDSVHDMRVLYERTRLLLVPSVWEESSARVIGEAQISGLPTVASDRGGLVESVGPGGACLALGDPLEKWCAAIESLFEDAALYATRAAGAHAHAARPDYQPERVVEAFINFVGR